MTFSRRSVLVGGAALLVARPAWAKDPYWYPGNGGYAADGADVVAYFDLDPSAKGVAGSSDLSVEWNGARWRFSTPETLAKFTADPEKYAPQFGGYCAYAMANGALAHGDINAWDVVDGKLYMNFNNSVRRRWRRDVPGNIASAQGHWPNVVQS